MKHTKHLRRLPALLLALALSLSLWVPASAEEAAGLEETAQSAAAAALAYGSGTSISWAVWQDGEIVESGSQVSETAPGKPGGDVYCIGSVSKIYTTAAVMQLAEAGKLNLDQPVTAYLPGFRMVDPRYKDITVRMLLNHSSGLMGSSMGSALLFDDDSDAGAAELLQRLSTQRLKADPGAYSVYCNDGFTLAELVVEAVSGQDLMDYLRANVLRTLDLTETYAPGEDFDRAAIYQADDPRALPADCLGVLGTGGIYATASDLAAFGGGLTGTSILSQASLEAMAAPEYAKGLWPEEGPDALAFGLGWDNVEWYPFSQSGIQALVKGGDTQYYHAGLVVLPEHNMAAAVLSAGGVSTYNEMAASQMLAAALSEKGVTVDERPLTLPEAKPAAMPEGLLKNAGYYGSILPYKVDLTPEGQLTMSYLSRPDVPGQTFTYHDDGTFRDATGTAYLKFVEENGQVYLYQRAFSELPALGGLPTGNYAAVKLPENKIDGELQALWDEVMSTVSIVPMNERYSSQIYLALGAAGTEFDSETESIPGYVSALRIADEARAEYVIQIPGNVGRDGYDLEMRRDGDGVLWMYNSNGAVYKEADALPVLSTGAALASRCTILPDGYARWYKIGENSAARTMTVEMPDEAGFWVYDKDFQVTASSVLWDDDSATLPVDGYVVFASEPGAVFRLTFTP